MSLIVDQEYIQRHIATRLNRFTKKDANLWNFRCPYCGDSQKNKRKTRGYIYKREQDYFFRCHNCQKGTTLGKLIEFLDPELYRQYLLDSYVEKNGDLRERVEPQKKNLFVRDDFEEPKGFLEKHGMIKISDLPNDHMAVVYLKRRCIPEKLWKHFYYLDDVGRLEELKDKYRDRIVGKEPRLILPYYDRKGNIFALTARALGDSKIKYLHIRLDEDIPLIYGLDRMDKTKELYVVEGQIDSLFLDNCVALSGGGITKMTALTKKKQPLS